jgi:hypothetical protein
VPDPGDVAGVRGQRRAGLLEPMRFWNCSGLIAVTARKFRWNADGFMRESLARPEIRIRSA